MFRYLATALILLILVGLTMLLYQLKLPRFKILIWMFGILLMTTVVFDTYLTALPIVLYNNNAILGVHIGTIPLEDFSYIIVLTILGPALFEFFTHEKK